MFIETARIDVTAVFAVLSCSCNFNYPFRKYNNVINNYLRFLCIGTFMCTYKYIV